MAGSFMTTSRMSSAQIMAGATEAADGRGGAAPKPPAGSQALFLRGSGEWADPMGDLKFDPTLLFENALL